MFNREVSTRMLKLPKNTPFILGYINNWINLYRPAASEAEGAIFHTSYQPIQVKVNPFSRNFNMGFIHTPTAAHYLFLLPKFWFQFQCIMNQPFLYQRVIYFNASFCHHLFNTLWGTRIRIVQWISNIPANRHSDDIFWKVTIFKTEDSFWKNKGIYKTLEWLQC